MNNKVNQGAQFGKYHQQHKSNDAADMRQQYFRKQFGLLAAPDHGNKKTEEGHQVDDQEQHGQ